jgi:hypothetical protein
MLQKCIHIYIYDIYISMSVTKLDRFMCLRDVHLHQHLQKRFALPFAFPTVVHHVRFPTELQQQAAFPYTNTPVHAVPVVAVCAACS